MSPRPRTVQNDAMLDAAERAMARRGPTTFALADVAAPLGITAQAVLMRFGSKHALVLGVAERRSRRAMNAAARAPGPVRSHVQAMRDFFERRMRTRDYDRQRLLGTLAFMVSGLGDPAVRPHIARQASAVRANLQALVSAACERGELHGDPAEIARLIESVFNGALQVWLIGGRGSAWSWFHPQLDRLLTLYGAPKARRRRGAVGKTS